MMSQNRVWPKVKWGLWGVFLVLLALLCGPVGIAIIRAIQLADWPLFWSPLVRFLLGAAFLIPFVWVILALFSPLRAVLPYCVQSWRELRSTAPFWMLVWAISWGGLQLSAAIPVREIRRRGLIRISQNGAPLIAAIEKFHARNSSFPANLSELTPEFLPGIPSTGAVSYPEFLYRRARKDNLFSSYELRVLTPIGGFNWDVFVFWPQRRYPARMYGGRVERIGDWAYVHE